MNTSQADPDLLELLKRCQWALQVEESRRQAANARLIAAAPELLELLKRCQWALKVEQSRCQISWEALLVDVRTAIERAVQSQ